MRNKVVLSEKQSLMESMKDKTPEERKEAMQKVRATFETCARDTLAILTQFIPYSKQLFSKISERSL